MKELKEKVYIDSTCGHWDEFSEADEHERLSELRRDYSSRVEAVKSADR